MLKLAMLMRDVVPLSKYAERGVISRVSHSPEAQVVRIMRHLGLDWLGYSDTELFKKITRRSETS
jgi:hypothetical protein